MDPHLTIGERTILDDALGAVKRTTALELHVVPRKLPQKLGDVVLEVDGPATRFQFVAEIKTANFVPVHLVVAYDDRHLTGNRRHRVNQVEGKRVVVIDD